MRAAICETIGRLPYRRAAQVEARGADAARDGGARRVGRPTGSASPRVRGAGPDCSASCAPPGERRGRAAAPSRDAGAPVKRSTGARVRRLALEALIDRGGGRRRDARRAARRSRRAGPPAGDARAPPAAAPQHRRPTRAHSVLTAGRADDSPIVRLEALRSLRARSDADACAAALVGRGRSRHARRAGRARSARRLRLGARRGRRARAHRRPICPTPASPRGWHRAAHALVALAAAAPERGAAALPQFTGSRDLAAAHVRGARRGAARRSRRARGARATTTTTTCARRRSTALRKLAGHDADAIYVAAARRAAAIRSLRAAALGARGHAAAATRRCRRCKARVAAARRRRARQLARRARRDRQDAGRRSASTAVGAGRRATPDRSQTDLNADDLRRLAAPRARDHDPRRRHLRAGAVHVAGAGDGAPLRAPRRSRATTTA